MSDMHCGRRSRLILFVNDILRFLLPPTTLVFIAPWPLLTLSMPSLAVDLNTRLRVIGVRQQIFGVRM